MNLCNPTVYFGIYFPILKLEVACRINIRVSFVPSLTPKSCVKIFSIRFLQSTRFFANFAQLSNIQCFLTVSAGVFHVLIAIFFLFFGKKSLHHPFHSALRFSIHLEYCRGYFIPTFLFPRLVTLGAYRVHNDPYTEVDQHLSSVVSI